MDDPRTNRYVLSLHGIQTRGAFQKDLNETLEHAGFRHIPLDYGYFLALQLLMPWSRRRKVAWFRDQYQQFRESHDDALPSVIAHSFGTYLACSALARYDLTFDQIILCGSIVPQSFPWTTFIDAKRVTRVLNDYGHQDIWARVVGWVVEDAGGSGVRGFDDKNPSVVERRNAEFGHSDYFYRLHYKDTWVPFLEGAVPAAAPLEPNVINWRFQAVRAVVVALICVLLFLGALHVHWDRFRPPLSPLASELDPCYAEFFSRPPGPYREIVWMRKGGLEYWNDGTSFNDFPSLAKTVWNELNQTLSKDDLGGLRTYGGQAQENAEENCKKPMPPLTALGVTTIVSGRLTVAARGMALEVYPYTTAGAQLRKVRPARVEVTNGIQRRAWEKLVNLATINLLEALDVPLSIDEIRRMAKASRIDASPATQEDALKGIGLSMASPPPWSEQSPLAAWLVPSMAWAQTADADAPLLTLLSDYCRALQARELPQVARFQELSSEQREAMGHYFDAAPDLTVECKDVQVLQANDRALVTFTRRDDYTDSRTGRRSHIEIRLSGECERQSGGWRFVAFKRPT